MVVFPPSTHTHTSTPTNKLLGFSPIDSPASTPSYKALHFAQHDSRASTPTNKELDSRASTPTNKGLRFAHNNSCASTPPNKALDSCTSTPTNKPLSSGPQKSPSILHHTSNGTSSSANVPALPQDDTVTDGPHFTLSQQSAAEEIDQEKIVYDIIDGCKDDKNEFFFDEFGGQLENTASKIAPLE